MTSNDEPIQCGFRVSSLVAVFASLILLTQVFSMLILIYSSWFFFFQMLLSFAMMFLLSNGIRKRRLAYVTAYFIYVAMYIFWGFFLVFGTIMLMLFVSTEETCKDEAADGSTTIKNCPTALPTKADYAIFGTACVIMSISIALAAIQLRHLFILYQYMRSQPRRDLPSYNVSYRIPVPTPCPPTYSQTQEAGPLPSKPPVYTEAVSSPSINPSASPPAVNLTSFNLQTPNQTPNFDDPPPSYEVPPSEASDSGVHNSSQDNNMARNAENPNEMTNIDLLN
ncbi:hypothetical protein WR25_18918 [Diploscapter pachys]|uniref:Uncharacterized protein n=1 Tax=Diploscapter pachys TaxID=2018661 RepID=A0A2A2KHG0_9BILA|nr:hypothetical protein WR25_18918 [Diploscapter pachys]